MASKWIVTLFWCVSIGVSAGAAAEEAEVWKTPIWQKDSIHLNMDLELDMANRYREDQGVFYPRGSYDTDRAAVIVNMGYRQEGSSWVIAPIRLKLTYDREAGEWYGESLVSGAAYLPEGDRKRLVTFAKILSGGKKEYENLRDTVLDAVSHSYFSLLDVQWIGSTGAGAEDIDGFFRARADISTTPTVEAEVGLRMDWTSVSVGGRKTKLSDLFGYDVTEKETVYRWDIFLANFFTGKDIEVSLQDRYIEVDGERNGEVDRKSINATDIVFKLKF